MKKIILKTDFALKPKSIVRSIYLFAIALTAIACSNDIDELDTNTAVNSLNNFSSYNTKTILAPVGAQGFVFPETAVFVNGKLLKKVFERGVLDPVAGTLPVKDSIYSSSIQVPDTDSNYPSYQVFELADALLDNEVTFTVTPGFTDTPANLATATPEGREQWQNIKLNLKKGDGDRIAVYKTADGKAKIQVIKSAFRDIAAPRKGYFKFRVINLSGTTINTSVASEYELPTGLNNVDAGASTDFVEIPYGSFRFLFKDSTGDNVAQGEVIKAKTNAFFSIYPPISFMPLQEFSSAIKVSSSGGNLNPGLASGILPYGTAPDVYQLFVDAIEQPYYAGGVYTAVIYPKNDAELCFSIVMDNLRNFAPQPNLGKITLVNSTTAPITATVGGITVNLAPGEFSMPQIVDARKYNIQSTHSNTEIEIATSRNAYLFAVETEKGEKKWIPIDYPNSPNLTIDNGSQAKIYLRYLNLSPDAGTVDFVYKPNASSGVDVASKLGVAKWEGQNLTFGETSPLFGVTFSGPVKVFTEILAGNSFSSSIAGPDIKAIGVATSIKSDNSDDLPGKLIASVPFVNNPFGATPVGATYTVFLIGKTTAAAGTSDAAKIIIHKHLF